MIVNIDPRGYPYLAQNGMRGFYSIKITLLHPSSIERYPSIKSRPIIFPSFRTHKNRERLFAGFEIRAQQYGV